MTDLPLCQLAPIETVGAVNQVLMDFLHDPASYGHPDCTLKVIESHMSFIFLIGDRAYKLKKPLKLDLLDNLSLEQRRRNCRRELALNRILSPDIYLDVVPVTVDQSGIMKIDGSGRPIDWLIVMRRLDENLLLDHAIPAGTVEPQHIKSIADTLVRFYRQAEIVRLEDTEIISNFRSLMDRNERSLRVPEFGLSKDIVEPLIIRLRGFLEDQQALILARGRKGWIRDCHGDLRPEHVYLGPPLRLIDRLEFCEHLRWRDPFEEIADLGLECERLGAPWIYPLLVDELTCSLGTDISEELLNFYSALHGCVRARLAIEHLRFEPENREIRQKQATDGLKLASKYACR